MPSLWYYHPWLARFEELWNKNNYYSQVPIKYFQDEEFYSIIKDKINNYEKILDIILYKNPELSKIFEKTSAGSHFAEEQAKQRYRDIFDNIDADEKRLSIKLYGHMHRRYVVSDEGLDKMVEKYSSGCYGKCPRHYCNGNNLLPAEVVLEEKPVTCFFCPHCQDLYNSKNINIFPGFFGKSFPHLFTDKFRNQLEDYSYKRYQTTLFGFNL